MPENSTRPRSEETETLQRRVVELESLLREERAKRQAAENVLRTTDDDANASASGATVELATSKERIRVEIERRERVELALGDSEALYHSLVEHLPISVYRIDMDGRITFGNSAYQQDLGRPLEELLGKTVFDLFPNREARKYDADDRRVIETGEVFHDVEEHDVRGEKFYVEVSKSPVHNRDGQPIGVQGLYWDVTAQKRAEEQLRTAIADLDRSNKALIESEALYFSLVEHVPVSVYRIDLDGRLTFGNSAYQKDLGRPLEELLGKTVFDLFPEAEARKYDADDQKVIESDKAFHAVEEHYVRGKQLYVEVLKCPVHNHEGRLVGVQGLYWDVTARKRTEEQLRKTMTELERSNKELQQFAGVASHDMHAPLRRIVALSAMLKEQYANQIDANGHELLGFVVAGAEHMQELIDDLLAHSRVGTSHKPLEAIDCDSTVRKARSNLAVLIDESAAEIHVARLPTVMAHEVELVQLFQNLIGNAIKYRGEVTPGVDVSAESHGDQWLFRVKDNGIGIPREHHAKIFEAFMRLHGDDKYPGTGIGLATCKKIVERLDGRIWVESHESDGSVFVFTLPRRGLSET
jgi:PAS domain S-box-containing protein